MTCGSLSCAGMSRIRFKGFPQPATFTPELRKSSVLLVRRTNRYASAQNLNSLALTKNCPSARRVSVRMNSPSE